MIRFSSKPPNACVCKWKQRAPCRELDIKPYSHKRNTFLVHRSYFLDEANTALRGKRAAPQITHTIGPTYSNPADQVLHHRAMVAAPPRAVCSRPPTPSSKQCHFSTTKPSAAQTTVGCKAAGISPTDQISRTLPKQVQVIGKRETPRVLGIFGV